jgi:tellurite resistance protein TehA-like permease
MNDPSSPNPLILRLRVLRIIHLALCFGAGVFLALVVYLRQVNPQPAPAMPMLTYVAIVFAVLGVTAAFLVPTLIEASWRRQIAQGINPGSQAANAAPLPTDPVERWAPLFGTRLILRCALLEGATFFQAIAYLVEGSPVTLGLGIGLWVLLLLQFPTLAGLERWIDTREGLMRQ